MSRSLVYFAKAFQSLNSVPQFKNSKSIGLAEKNASLTVSQSLKFTIRHPCYVKLQVFVYLIFFIVVYREWEKEVHKAAQVGRDASFLCAIVRAFGLGYSLLGLVALMHVS